MPIDSPNALSAVLEKHGYVTKTSADTVFVTLGGTEAPYTASFAFHDQKSIKITCQLAVLGDFPEETLPQLALAALDANTQISPYAFAIIGAAEKEPDPETAPLVLIDTLLTADLSEEEVVFSLDKLLEALTFSAGILKLGFAGVK